MHRLRWFLLLLALGYAPLLHAQWVVQEWVTTTLHDDAQVDLPYEAKPVEIPDQPQGLKVFETTTADVDFSVMSLDRRYFPGYRPGQGITPKALNRFFNKQSRLYGRQVFGARLLEQANVVFAESPARAVVYEGFDYDFQQPTRIETVWVWRVHALYLFVCTYRLPEQAGVAPSKKKFFSSVRFEKPVTTTEL
ncbi:hypothetical protein F0P96_11155 [Hymenobacter busanensis]|uniref:Uncharacterized protein n=1 Tax=Hymenobacter busanensis TaxID=2607656 RepID=A0A7L5A1M6_9BACT|nr:hypothetical protein [Hymenobacter busanensis]KAA9332042.1 hypothetical protein F0P96_11155 [Hymenobacter busanensis]QHJ07620.1 hypothetical protein GUY19_10120 [Hymenobacter busanensis]